jgi:hypothetical protein
MLYSRYRTWWLVVVVDLKVGKVAGRGAVGVFLSGRQRG